MKIDLEHLKRYKDIALLFIKYGRSDIIKQAGSKKPSAKKKSPTQPTSRKKKPTIWRRTWKISAAPISNSDSFFQPAPNLLPPAHLKTLARLQDDVEPFSCEEVDQIVSNGIGVRISKAFAEFVEKLPHRVNNILDIIGNDDLYNSFERPQR